MEFIQGDFFTRFFEKENDVFFNLGLDEHGQKIFKAAQDAGIDTKEYLDRHYEQWLEFCNLFDIEYDNFYRTSDSEHHRKVSEVWEKFTKSGLIYKKKYQGQYCEGCESFKQDKDLEEGKCPDHPHLDIQIIEEENYFFKLSSFKKSLITNYLEQDETFYTKEQIEKFIKAKYIKKKPFQPFLFPTSKKPELANLIDSVEDISISRLKSSVPWGVPVPGDEEQTIYVWFDALLNYVFSANETGDFKWSGFHEYPRNCRTIQICGPDNLRFQGLIFQALLHALDLAHTDKLLVHGTILDDQGRKIGKSLGNTIDPVQQLEKFGLEAIRYYILSLSTFGNTNWDEDTIVKIYNAHLVNDYGNLIARTLHLIDKKEVEIVGPEDSFKEKVDASLKQASNFIEESYNIHDYCSKLNELVKSGNQYINEKEPWKQDDYTVSLNNLYYLLTEVTEYYSPIIPQKIEEVKTALLNLKKEILFARI